jgi:hypothetical protein
MSIEDFKTIYFWEWLHRLWGRLIGIAFAVPFLWFLLRRRIPTGLMPRLLGILVLGGLQGVLGWVMVESGLVDRVEVSQYRLVAHLGLAIVIYAAILWTALDLLWGRASLALLSAGWTARGQPRSRAGFFLPTSPARGSATPGSMPALPTLPPADGRKTVPGLLLALRPGGAIFGTSPPVRSPPSPRWAPRPSSALARGTSPCAGRAPAPPSIPACGDGGPAFASGSALLRRAASPPPRTGRARAALAPPSPPAALRQRPIDPANTSP